MVLFYRFCKRKAELPVTHAPENFLPRVINSVCQKWGLFELIFSFSALGEAEVKYTIYFNSRETLGKDKAKEDENEEEGPVVERKCPKCGNDKMSYATLQLRSADEGQTVFYTCIKCKYKENENS